MIIFRINIIKWKHVILMIYGTILLVVSYMPALAQEQPPKPILVTVDLAQNLNFGSFCYGNGVGTTVTIDANGARSKTGNIILISSSFSAARYIVTALPGTLINISNGAGATLSGGGFSMTMQIGDSYPQSPFITTGATTIVTIGGTLNVGALGANPPGAYSGTFAVTFIQQ